MLSQGAPPVDCESMRTPSMYTAVKRDSAPRRNTPVVVPGPPLRENSTPGRRASRSARPVAPLASMVSRSTMEMSATRSASGCGVRVAATTVSDSDGARRFCASSSPVAGAVCAKAPQALPANSDSSARRGAGRHNDATGRARRVRIFMGIKVNKQPGPASRQRVGDTAAQRQKRAHAATVLAGIRAGGTPPNAFPGACSRRPVAYGWRENRAIRPLTVAGAAQAGRVPVVRRLPASR